MSADIFYQGFFLSSFFFSRLNLRACWTELNQNWPYALKLLWFENACPKSGVSPSLKIGDPKTTFFGWLHNLTATLTAYIFGTKHDIDKQSSALTTTRGLLHCLRMSWTLVHKRLQTGPPFLPTLCKFCFLRHCQALQMKISKQNSTKLCQTADGKSR